MTTKRFNEDDDKSIVEYGKMKQKELLNEIVKVERKYDLTFAEYIVCEKCGTLLEKKQMEGADPDNIESITYASVDKKYCGCSKRKPISDVTKGY